MKKLGFLLFLVLMLGIASGTALAQGDNSVYFVTYYANNTTAAPDATLRFVNDGDTAANIYASIYVFDDSQELQECGSCVITPDGLLSESVKNELTHNTLTSKAVYRGVIKVISSSVSAGGPGYTNTPVAGLRGWATHIQSAANKYPYGAAPYSQTETPLADSNLGASEKSLLENLCSFAQELGSGTGIISCTPEDYDF
jgi:hypothetical protein